MTSEAATRKRNANRCAHASNLIIVEELQAMRKKMRPNSNLASNYQRAITSIQKFAYPIRSGSEAQCLKNIGNYMANQIQSILTRYQPAEADQIIQNAKKSESKPISKCKLMAIDANGDKTVSTRTRSSKEYVPAFQKKPWFILTALNEKKAMDEESAVHLEKVFDHAKSIGFQGAMVQLKTCCAQLSSSHQVIERNVYGAWYLTEKGKQSAQRRSPIDTQMLREEIGGKAAQALEFHDTVADQYIKTHIDSDVENIDPEAELEPHIRGEKLPSQMALVVKEDLCQDMDQWTLILLLDHREVVSRRNRSILERKLTENGVTCEVRGLHIGDMIWIARRNRGDSVDEFVMDVIVERKEVRDLSGSIIDRRFAEQKQRLQACGIKHVVYLVEGSMSQQTTVMKGGLEDALCLTEFRDNFMVHMSQNADDTVAYLSAIHRRLLARFPRAQCLNPEVAALCPSRFLSSVSTSFTTLFATPPISFAEFNRKFQKRAKFTASEMYQRMLTQIPTLSTAKIAAIVHHYKNFDQLIGSMQSIEQLDEGTDASFPRLCQIRYGEKNQLLDTRSRNIIRILLQSDDYNVS